MVTCRVAGRGMGTRAILTIEADETDVVGRESIVGDVWVFADGRTAPRRTARRHEVGPAEALRVAAGARTLVVGTGCLGKVRVAPRTREALRAAGISLLAAPTPESVTRFNELQGPRAAIFHAAC